MERVYFAARWDKGTADYINCPMDRAEYDRFLDALLAAEAAESKEWEKLEYFEGCLPIEVLARRGRDTLRFGPMKPVGLRDPRTGQSAVGGGAVAQRESARRQLQPGRLSESFEVWRAGPRAAPDSRAGECEVSALRADPSQHVYLRACPARRDSSPEGESSGRSLPGRFPAWRATRNRLRRECWRGSMRRRWCGARSRRLCRGPRRSGRWFTTSRMPMRRTFNRRISPSICWSRWKRKCARECATKRSGTGWCASERWRHLKRGGLPCLIPGMEPAG